MKGKKEDEINLNMYDYEGKVCLTCTCITRKAVATMNPRWNMNGTSIVDRSELSDFPVSNGIVAESCLPTACFRCLSEWLPITYYKQKYAI